MGVNRSDLLGRVLSTHRGSQSNVLAGYVLTCLAAVGGALLLFAILRGIWQAEGNLPWNAKIGWSWFAVFFGLIATVLIFVIAGFFWWMTRSTATRVTSFHENGLAVEEGDRVSAVVLWAHLICIVEVDVTEPIPIFHFPANLLLPRWKSKRFEIWSTDNTTPICFEKGSISDLAAFASSLRQVCAKLEIPLLEKEEHHT